MKTVRFISIGLFLVVLLALIITACAQPAPAPVPAPTPAPAPAPAPELEVFKWKAQSSKPPGTHGFEMEKRALDLLREMTDGQLDITLHGVGDIVGNAETLGAMGKGVLEVTIAAAGYYGGLDPGFSLLQSMPGVLDDPRQMFIWYKEFGGDEIRSEAYAEYNVHFVSVLPINAEALMSKVPLRSPSDFKGVKIRTMGGFLQSLFSALGASPIAMPGSEIYSALDTGVIDAAEFITLTDDYGLGLHEVTDYFLWPSFHAPTGAKDISVGMDAWNSLPDDLKACFNAAAAVMAQTGDFAAVKMDAETYVKVTEYGLEHIKWSEADLQSVKDISLELYAEWRTKSEMANKVVTSVFDFLRVTEGLDN